MAPTLRHSRRTLSFQLASLCFFGLVCGSNCAQAEEHLEDISDVTIFVRTIEATDPISGDVPQDGGTSDVKMDQALKDLRPKLAQLPFSSFKLIASKEEQLSLKRKEIMHLPNGQSLALRPIYMDQKRVGVWLNWKDTGGADILNTRIHFDADDSVLTGTDCAHDAGLILAIKAVPVAH
jgi:hypothetical protein